MLMKDFKNISKKILYLFDGNIVTQEYKPYKILVWLILFVIGLGLTIMKVELGVLLLIIGAIGLVIYVPIRALRARSKLKKIRITYGHMLLFEGKKSNLFCEESTAQLISQDVDDFVISKLQSQKLMRVAEIKAQDEIRAAEAAAKEQVVKRQEEEANKLALEEKYQKLKQKGKQKINFDVILASDFDPEPAKAILIWHSIDSDWDDENSISLKIEKKITSVDDIYLDVSGINIPITDFVDWKYDQSSKVIDRKSSSSTIFMTAHKNVDLFGGITLGGAAPITRSKHEKGREILNIFLGINEKRWLNLSTEISYGRFGDNFIQHELNVLLRFLQKYFSEKMYQTALIERVKKAAETEEKIDIVESALNQIRERILKDPNGKDAYKDILRFTAELRKKIEIENEF